MSYNTTLALNENWDLAVTTRNDGLKTLTLACDHRMNYQLVRTGLIANKQGREIENQLWINWNIYSTVNSPFQLLASQISALISSFEHIEYSSLNGAEYNIEGDTLRLTGICFLSDCDTSKTMCEVNL